MSPYEKIIARLKAAKTANNTLSAIKDREKFLKELHKLEERLNGGCNLA